MLDIALTECNLGVNIGLVELERLHLQRNSKIHRVTNETDVTVRLDLDGSGKSNISSGIAFLDHMLHQISNHGLFDLEVKASGDSLLVNELNIFLNN